MVSKTRKTTRTNRAKPSSAAKREFKSALKAMGRAINAGKEPSAALNKRFDKATAKYKKARKSCRR